MSTIAPDRPGTRRRTTLIALLAVNLIANTGIKIAAIAIPWFVLTTTGSAAQTGLVAACELAPYVLAKALGGPIVDRLGQRRVSIVADLVSAVVLGAIPVLGVVGMLPLPVLLVLVILGGAVRGPGDNAKSTAIPAAAELAEISLDRAMGFTSAIERSSGLVAPAAAAVMIAFLGADRAVAVTAACFALSALVVALLVRGIGAGDLDHGAREGEGYLRQFRAGWSYLRNDRLLLTLTLMIMVTNLIDIAKTAVLLPVWAVRTGAGVEALGIVFTAVAIGQVITSLIASAIAERLPRRLIYFLGFLIGGPPPFIALALGAGVEALAVVYVIAGLAAGFLNPILGAMFYERIPAALLGRVSGLTAAIAYGGMPFGGLIAAALLAGLDFAPTMILLAAVYAAAVVLPALVSPSFDRPTPRSACLGA